MEYNNYEQITEIKRYIKSLFSEILQLEISKNNNEEELFDRIIYLLELYISTEVDNYITKNIDCIITKVLDKLNEKKNEQK